MEKEIIDLSVKNPYSVFEIDQIYTKCRTMYWPKEKALSKTQDILNTASEFAISPIDAYWMQFEIDFTIL